MGVFNIERGCEASIQWRFKIATTPKDLTGFTVLVQIRPTKTSPDILGSWTAASPSITFTPAAGTVLLSLTPAETLAMAFNHAMIDCLVYDSVDGDRSPAYEVVINHGVSRP